MSPDSVFDAAEAWTALGQRLSAHRKAAGFTQETFAAHLAARQQTFYGRSSVANVERGKQRISRDFWIASDNALETGGALATEYDRIMRAVSARRIEAVRAAPAWRPDVSRALSSSGWAGTVLRPDALAPPRHLMPTAAQGDQYLWTPPGRRLPGSAIPAQLHRAVLDGHVVTQVPVAYADDPFLNRPGRGLVVGQLDHPSAAAFVVDSRYARGRLRGAGPDARLLIPRAYRLDELTFALLWAVSNFDDALLADDAVIAAGLRDTEAFAQLDKSAASRDMAADAGPVSQMWLGSQFCANHIRRHASALTDQPVYWTREQRGEEAATWLLFDHKHQYLRETSTRAHDQSPLVRAFCVPRQAVDDSPTGERMLLLLALALMESHGIRTVVTDIAELAGTPGFVSDRHRTAITATWIGADGIWYADVTDNRTTVRGYDDAAGYAIDHSINDGQSPRARLRAFAEYLQLEWSTLAVRCAELGEWGAAGIAQPRSRLLSVDGFDRACRYLGSVDQHGD
jgi:transcriptional regulator with XRE-family HTH domain